MKNAGLRRTLNMMFTGAMAGIAATELYCCAKAAKILADPTIPNEAITINNKPLVEKPKDDIEEK